MILWIIITGSFSWQSLSLGFFLSILSLVLFDRALSGRWITRSHRSRPYETTSELGSASLLQRLVQILLFIPLFAGKIFVSGIQITRLALTPGVSFWPGIVSIHSQLPNLSAKTAFATAITLTPGTLTLDYIPQEDLMYIHWIDVSEYHSDSVDREVSSGLRPWMLRMFS